MKVLFIYIDLAGPMPGWTGHFYSGLGYLSALLKAAGHEVGLIHLVEPPLRDEFHSQLDLHAPDLVGFSVTSLMYSHARRYAAWVNAWGSVFTICGGVHATLCPNEVMADGLFDAVCIGEGEGAILELTNALAAGEECSHIHNLWFKRGDSVIRNPLRPLVQNLDTLPFPDRSIFCQPNSFIEQGTARIMASRGCLYRCSYCANSAFARLFSSLGPYMRYRSPENVIREIETLAQSSSPPSNLWFDDDVLPFDADWFCDFASGYRARVGLPYQCYLRPNMVTEDVVRLLIESGCYRVHLGVETGNETLRFAHLNRRVSNEQLRRAFDICAEAGLETVSLNMVGLPKEDMRRAIETVKLNADLKPARISVSIFYPIPGTDLGRECSQKGLIGTRSVDNIYTETTLQNVLLSPAQISFLRRRFGQLVSLYQRVYQMSRVWRSVLEFVLDGILSSRCFAWVIEAGKWKSTAE